jgi:transcription antitermination factor NusG
LERSVALAVRCKGYEALLPLYRAEHKWSDRMKLIELPLLPGYIFCRLEAENRLPLLTIPGVVHFVGVGNTPVPVADSEIDALQAAIKSELKVEPWPFVEVGQRVQVESGPLGGIEGYLVNAAQRHRIVVNLSALRRSVAVEIDHRWLGPANDHERYIR